MAKERLYSRAVIGDLAREINPASLISHFVRASLRVLESLDRPIDWTTLKITIGRDDEQLTPGMHAITMTAYSKEA